MHADTMNIELHLIANSITRGGVHTIVKEFTAATLILLRFSFLQKLFQLCLIN